jgi:hypothetical protein
MAAEDRDRLHKDYDNVENLSDLIRARSERVSAESDDTDAMEDTNPEGLALDPSDQLTYPHPHTRSDQEAAEGINVELMGTPGENEIGFDWQDSVEEMLPTDPDASEGMGLDSEMAGMEGFDTGNITGSTFISDKEQETDITATKEEKEELGTDGGEPFRPSNTIDLDTAMDTDSDEEDFSIEDRFAGQALKEDAEYDFEVMRTAEEQEEGESG